MADLDPGFWAQGMAMFIHHALSPWLGLVDPPRYAAEVDRVQAMGMTTIATAHSPLITSASVAHAFTLLRNLPNVTVFPPRARPDDPRHHPRHHGDGGVRRTVPRVVVTR